MFCFTIGGFGGTGGSCAGAALSGGDNGIVVARGQVVAAVWEDQPSDQLRLASRTQPSDQQKRGFLVPVEPCALERLGAGQPQDEIPQWLRLRRLHHR